MKRFQQIDFIRGALLIIMTIDHLSSPLRRFTYQSFGFVSGAEGFVFVSGLVAGLVFSKIVAKSGLEAASSRMLSRSFEIYQYHIGILIILVVGIFSIPYVSDFWTSEDPLFRTQPILASLLTTLFFYQPDHLNILPIYCIFLLFAPLALRLLFNQKYGLLLAISIGIWGISILGFRDQLSDYLNRFAPIDLGYFNVYSWQLLFFTGMFLGHLKWKNSLERFVKNNTLFYICVVISGGLFIGKHFLVSESFIHDSFWVDKTALGPMRLLNFYTVAYVVAYILNRFLHLGKFQPVVFLGKYSLQVFAFHVVLTIFVMPIASNLDHHLTGHPFSFNDNMIKVAETLVTLISVILLYIPALIQDLVKKRVSVINQ